MSQCYLLVKTEAETASLETSALNGPRFLRVFHGLHENLKVPLMSGDSIYFPFHTEDQCVFHFRITRLKLMLYFAASFWSYWAKL